MNNPMLRAVATQRPTYDVEITDLLPYDVEYSLAKLLYRYNLSNNDILNDILERLYYTKNSIQKNWSFARVKISIYQQCSLK